METHVRRSSYPHKDFFSIEGLTEQEITRQINPVARRFEKWLDEHEKFPEEYIPFLLRDILGYSKKDVDGLTLEGYNFAVHYALTTYVRRDVLFIMQKAMGDKKKKGNLDFKVRHPGIDEWIAEQYENVKENTKV